MKRRSVIAVANEQVSILLVCELIGMSVPSEISGRSYKTSCPFGEFYHSDGGAVKAFRIYPDTNSANCFASCGYFTPVWLASMAWGRRSIEVAVQLLDKIGYKPATQADLWASMQRTEKAPDPSALVVALRTYCERTDANWGWHQYDPAISRTLDRCLRLLDNVHTDIDAQEWLFVSKQVMDRACREGESRG